MLSTKFEIKRNKIWLTERVVNGVRYGGSIEAPTFKRAKKIAALKGNGERIVGLKVGSVSEDLDTRTEIIYDNLEVC